MRAKRAPQMLVLNEEDAPASQRCALIWSGPKRRPSQGVGTLRALESCRTATWVQLRPIKLRVLSHTLDMAPSGG
jgi:hypothetical protein